ncbi:uncharacterized protein N7506_008279 [Penicillium brevicompactum]|uniref:uncharacterized protein n=1 Tax=Penicillium brevicompactum TaxID=5074 RepID=UPI00253FB56B|nr:uncharacterized protein N7506_008279 [Penicillium brevicompactum]KAJ5325177.1 hypothetical protein N7506_008279 [Penicillium brevicompactum]
MRAVRFHGARDIRLDEIEEPVCGVDQVKIRPAFVGICGSDLHEYLSGPCAVPVTPHPLTGEKLPTTLGHELSGTIEEVGSMVSGFKVGDRVTVMPNLYDGTCVRCQSGKLHQCEKLGFIGFSGSAGGLSDHLVVRKEHVVLLPDSIPLEIGALVEPLAVAWHAISQSPIQKMDQGKLIALVVGVGPIGLAIVQGLKAQGVETIVAADVSSKRRESAAYFGATLVLDPIQADLVSHVRGLTIDGGASIAFECSGVQAGFDSAVAATRSGGTTVIVSQWMQRASFDIFDVMLHEKHLVGAVVYERKDFEAVIKAIDSGKIQPGSMVTSKIRMDQVAEKGFKALIEERDLHVKILVEVGDIPPSDV